MKISSGLDYKVAGDFTMFFTNRVYSIKLLFWTLVNGGSDEISVSCPSVSILTSLSEAFY